jgi:hypothetical protein
MQYVIPYFLTASLTVYLKDKIWWFDAKEVYAYMGEPYSLLTVSLSGEFCMMDDKALISFEQVKHLINSPYAQNTLFKAWFELNFSHIKPKSLTQHLEHLSSQEKAVPAVTASQDDDFNMDLLNEDHSLLQFEHFVLRIYMKELEPCVNTADLVRLLGYEKSSNFIKRYARFIHHPFTTYINPQYRQSTTYMSIRLIALLEFGQGETKLKGLTACILEHARAYKKHYNDSEESFLSSIVQERLMSGIEVDEYGLRQADYSSSKKGQAIQESQHQAFLKAQSDLMRQLGIG